MSLSDLLSHLLRPPPLPPMPSLPWGSHIAGLDEAIRNAFELAYWTGVKDGFFLFAAGLVALAVIAFVFKSNILGMLIK